VWQIRDLLEEVVKLLKLVQMELIMLLEKVGTQAARQTLSPLKLQPMYSVMDPWPLLLALK
jgi:hypothetical protein